MQLLGIGTDSKTVKGEQFGVLTGILYLAPSDESKVMNTCPKASKGCRLACLYSAGRGAFNNVRQARIRKTIAFWQDREKFMSNLMVSIQKLVKKASKNNLIAAVRLNGTSDIAWETIIVANGKNIMQLFPNVKFYDYTKRVDRMLDYVAGKMPSNYHLTFSRSESNQTEVETVLKAGGNVAVVFSGKSLPSSYLNVAVINGDESDIRFFDARGVVVGLIAKGKAKKDATGFVVRV